MAAAIGLREGFDGSRLRGLAKRTRDANQMRRLLALAEIYDGIAQGVDEGVDFGGQSATRSADGLFAVFFRAPALC
jgi:hypothetical protein